MPIIVHYIVSNQTVRTRRSSICIVFLVLFIIIGMHKKSIEASHKLQEEEDVEKDNKNMQPRDRDEIRSESIATLRAKAQQHSAKVLEALGVPPIRQEMTSSQMETHMTSHPVKGSSCSDNSGCTLGLDLDCLSDTN